MITALKPIEQPTTQSNKRSKTDWIQPQNKLTDQISKPPTGKYNRYIQHKTTKITQLLTERRSQTTIHHCLPPLKQMRETQARQTQVRSTQPPRVCPQNLARLKRRGRSIDCSRIIQHRGPKRRRLRKSSNKNLHPGEGITAAEASVKDGRSVCTELVSQAVEITNPAQYEDKKDEDNFLFNGRSKLHVQNSEEKKTIESSKNLLEWQIEENNLSFLSFHKIHTNDIIRASQSILK